MHFYWPQVRRKRSCNFDYLHSGNAREALECFIPVHFIYLFIHSNYEIYSNATPFVSLKWKTQQSEFPVTLLDNLHDTESVTITRAFIFVPSTARLINAILLYNYCIVRCKTGIRPNIIDCVICRLVKKLRFWGSRIFQFPNGFYKCDRCWLD